MGNPNSNVVRGTAIATFNEDGRYGPPGTKDVNQNHNNHAAFFLSFGAYMYPDGIVREGIWVIDQWQNRKDANGNAISGIRFIPIKEGVTDPSNNARAFSVIMVKKPQQLRKP